VQMSKTVFVDVDTQVDFMRSDGALYVPDAERIIPDLKKLIDAAVKKAIPIISTADNHREDDEEMKQFPPHCIGGTPGQKKIPETTTSGLINLPNRPYPGDLSTIFDHYDQVVLEANTLDKFSNCNTDPLIRKLFADEYFVFGVATEYCVRLMVLGLLDRGKKVTLLTDAVKPIQEAAGKAAIDEVIQHGAKLASASEVISRLDAASPR